jgi:antitoxin VapB
MTLNIRNPEADHLARELARIDESSITDAVIVALRETIRNRLKAETPTETAKRLLAKHGLRVQPGHKPVPQSAYHDMDHDLTGED